MINSDGAVYDIPTGLLICCIEGKEVNVNAISTEYIEIKMASKLDLNKFTSLDLMYLDFKRNQYRSFNIYNYECVNSQDEKFCITYEFKINDQNYDDVVRFIIKQYQDYIIAKIYEEPIGNYPKQKDDIISSSYEEWISNHDRQTILKKISEKVIKNVHNKHVELAITLDNHKLYKQFLEESLSDKDDEYIKEIIELSTRVYIGNQFCHNQFPDNNTLTNLMNLAKSKGKVITVCFTYLRQELIEKTLKSLKIICEWSRQNDYPIEIIINDFGMLELINSVETINERSSITLSLGILLNKRRKDPRLKYKYGNATSPQNQTNQVLFSSFLHKYGIERIEQEAVNYKLDLNQKFNHSLHLPLYQTNTSQYCTLHALCQHFDRSKQKFVMDCPRYCEQNVCLYPEHLHMIGKYNSIFALIDDYIKLDLEGYDRIVWNLN